MAYMFEKKKVSYQHKLTVECII